VAHNIALAPIISMSGGGWAAVRGTQFSFGIALFVAPIHHLFTPGMGYSGGWAEYSWVFLRIWAIICVPAYCRFSQIHSS